MVGRGPPFARRISSIALVLSVFVSGIVVNLQPAEATHDGATVTDFLLRLNGATYRSSADPSQPHGSVQVGTHNKDGVANGFTANATISFPPAPAEPASEACPDQNPQVGIGNTWTKAVDLDTFNWTGRNDAARYVALVNSPTSSRSWWLNASSNVLGLSTVAVFDAQGRVTTAGGVDGVVNAVLRAYWLCTPVGGGTAVRYKLTSTSIPINVHNVLPKVPAADQFTKTFTRDPALVWARELPEYGFPAAKRFPPTDYSINATWRVRISDNGLNAASNNNLDMTQLPGSDIVPGIEVDLSKFLPGTSVEKRRITNGHDVSLKVNETQDLADRYDHSTAVLPVTVINHAGTRNTVNLILPIDNARPGTSPGFQGWPNQPAINLNVNVTPAGGRAYVRWNWSGSATMGDVVGAKVSVDGVGERLWGTARRHDGRVNPGSTDNLGRATFEGNVTYPTSGRPQVRLQPMERSGSVPGGKVASVLVGPPPEVRITSPAFEATPIQLTQNDLKQITVRLSGEEVGTPSNNHPTFYVWLRNSAGQFWVNDTNDTSGASAPQFTAWGTKSYVTPWRKPVLAGASEKVVTFTNFSRAAAGGTRVAADFPPGTYALGIAAKDNAGHEYNWSAYFRLDENKPRFSDDATHHKVISTTVTQDEKLVVSTNVTEGLNQRSGDAGIQNVSVSVRHPGNFSIRRAYWPGAPVLTADCVPCRTPLTGYAGTGLNRTLWSSSTEIFEAFTTYRRDGSPAPTGNVSVSVPGLTVGVHAVQIDARDKAGNVDYKRATGTVTVVPRLLEAPAREPGKPPSPFYLTAAGDLKVHVYASYSNLTDTNVRDPKDAASGFACVRDPVASSTARYCSLSNLKVLGYKGTGAPVELVSDVGTKTSNDLVEYGGIRYFNYTLTVKKSVLAQVYPASDYPDGVPEPFKIRIAANVTVPKPTSGAWTYTNTLDNLVVKKPSSQGGAAIRYPSAPWALNFTGEPGKLRLNATISVPSWQSYLGTTEPKARPIAEFTLRDLATRKLLKLVGDDDPDTPEFLDDSAANKPSTTLKREAFLVRCPGAACGDNPWVDAAGAKYTLPKALYNFSLDAAFRNASGPRKVNVTRGTGTSQERLTFDHLFNPVRVPDGQYQLTARFVTNVTGQPAGTLSTVLGEATQYFAVESSAPVVRILYDAVDANGTKLTEVFNDRDDGTGTDWVHRQFRVRAEVDTGFANLTGTPALALKRVVSLLGETLWATPENSPGVDLTLSASKTQLLASGEKRTALDVVVALPTRAIHNASFQVLFNASTDLLKWGAPASIANASGPNAVSGPVSELRFEVHLDDEQPIVGFDAANVSAYGKSGAFAGIPGLPNEKVLFGPATDLGSGTKRVQVHIVDVTESKTWSEAASPDQWIAHEQPYWLNATLVQHATLGVTWWRYGTTELQQAMERHHEFRVDVRAVDRSGFDAQPRNFTFSFDTAAPTAPVPFDLTFASGSAVASTTTNVPPTSSIVSSVSWKNLDAAKSLAAKGRVTDDACLAEVVLVLEAPSGLVTRAPLMAPKASRACPASGTDAFEFNTGTAASRAVPFPAYALNDTGVGAAVNVYKAYFEAKDQTGKTLKSPKNWWFRVIDDYPAQIVNAFFIPASAAAGGFTTLNVDLFENSEMGRVEARFFRDATNGTYDPTTPIAFGNATRFNVTANGTGRWTLSTRDANLSLDVGQYTAQVRVLDKTGRGSSICEFGRAFTTSYDCTGMPLAVRATAPPAVTVDSPTGSGYANGTVRFRATVSSTDMEPTGITLRVGNSTANLQRVTPQVVPIANRTNRTIGYVVFHNVTVTTDADPIIMNITVRDRAGVLAYGQASVTVDLTPPDASARFDDVVAVDGRTFARPGARLTVERSDAKSGVDAVTCRVDDGPAADCSRGFAFNSLVRDGDRVVNVTVTDKAGNQAHATVPIALDRAGPEVDVLREDLDLLVGVRDTTSGVDEANVTLYYAIVESPDDVAEFAPLALAADGAGGYGATIEAPEGTVVLYYVVAVDRVGNVGLKHSALAPGVIGDVVEPPPGNAPPTLLVSSPKAGETLKGRVSVQWTASDPDAGQTLVVNVTFTGTKSGTIATNLLDAAGSHTWDTSTLPDGPYTVTVTVTDGLATVDQSVSFTLKSTDTFKIVTAPEKVVQKGESVTFQVRVEPSKSIEKVTVEYVKAGRIVQARALKEQAPGLYADLYVPPEPGNYTVRLNVAYEGGTREPPLVVGTFEVAGATSGPVAGAFAWTVQIVSLVAVGAATMLLAAYAAFVRWKR